MLKVDLDYYGKTYGFDIENEDQWNGLENDWQKRKFLVDKLVDAGKIDKPDGAFDYSVDQAQRMFSKGIEVFGRASGVEAIEEFGRENAEAQVQDMQAGRYEPFYTKSLRETYNEDGLFSALDWVREKSIENSASSAAGIGGALATAGASFISAPAAVVAGIATLAATITQGTGETALEMEEKTGDYNSLLAIGSGTLIGILDRFGAGKVINKDDLAKMTVEELTNKLRKEGFNEAAESILKSTTKRITKSVGSEAVTEGAQNLISQGATSLAGGEYTGQEVLDSTLESAVLGGTMGGAVTGTVSTVANTPNIASSISDTTKRFANFRSTSAFEDNPRLASSDARVADMFDEEKSKINATKQGTDVAEDVVFKNIQDRLKNNFKEVSDALFKANKITGGEKKVFNQIVSRAAKHNRALTAPIGETTEADLTEDITGGFESDQEFINDLDLDQADKDLVLAALLDLETVTEAGMKNRAVGTFRELARRFGVTAGASAGATLGGGVGAAVGASAGQRTLESIGQSIDKLFGLNRPKVLKRGEARRKAADVIGRDYGNTPRDLSDLIQRLIEQQVTVNTKQDKGGIAPERQALVDFLNEAGAPRAGGWLETVRQSVQAALDGTGVAVSQEDVLATIAEVQRLGYLDEAVADDLLLNRGGQITIPKLILDISDATLKFVRDREGIAPNPQSEAKANTATQEAQTRREANIQQGIEDNRRVLDASKAELDADKKIPKADKAKLSEALRNMRLDLGRNPVEAIQNIVKDLRKSGVDEASIQAYILPYATRVAQQQQQNDVVFSQVDTIPEVETAPASNPNPVNFNGSTPIVEGQSQETINKHGFNPHLRVETNIPEGRDKPLFTQKTNNKNADQQINNIDTVLERHPDVLESPEAFTAMLADALASNDVPIPPFKLIADINNDGSFNLLNTLTDGQMADADKGFENARQFREAYINGEVTSAETGKLFLWSFLSRGVSPYAQESMFIDAYDGIGKYIEAAAQGDFDLDAYLKWASTIAPAGSGQPGAGSSHNLNAFGKNFLIKMSQDAGLGDGRSRLQVIHDMMSDPNTTGKEIRRQFLRMGEGVGIDNKVVSFTLLVAGHSDVMVLDRVQLRNMFNDGRFGDLNLWDGYKVDGAVVTGSSLADITYGARGLLIYEAIEQSIQSRLNDIYTKLGRPQDAQVGRYHWETWVASSGQEASHSTVDAILNEIKGSNNPILNIRSKEGEYGAYAYGAQYGLDSDGASFVYSIPDKGSFKFDVPEFQEFLSEIKKPKNGVVPRLFKVSEVTNKPWYETKGVDKNALREQALKYGKEIEEDPNNPEGGQQVRPIDGSDGTNQNVPDRPPTNQSDAPNQNQEGILTDYSIVDPQQEFDFDVQGIPNRPTTDGQAAREIKENLEEAEGLIEFGKPGSPFENGIKNYKQLNAVLTAIGLADKLFIVPSQAEMKRVAEKLGGKLPSDTTGLMGFAVQNRETGKTKGIVVLQQGTGGKKVPQDAEFTTAVHETAHAIEFSSLVNFNFVRQTAVSRPYSVTTQTIQESSLRDILNDYLTSLGRDRRDFDNDPIVREIREIQTNESITAPAGQSGRMRPGYNIEAYMDGYDKARAIADAEGKTIRIDREGYRAEALDKLRRRGENYYETAAEFTVDPLLFMMSEPKIAKEKYPNIYKFIQDVMNGEDPTGISDNLKKDGKLKFYTAPFSVILAAVLSAMGMAEDEEELPPVSPPNRGALRPQPGALSI